MYVHALRRNSDAPNGNARCNVYSVAMAPPFETRLDPVIRLRERAEEKAERELGQANQRVTDAETHAKEMAERARKEERKAGDAAHWELAEVGHIRARQQAQLAKEEVIKRQREAKVAKDAHAQAHLETEIVRRVAETRRDEMKAEALKKENRGFDELATIRFSRKDKK